MIKTGGFDIILTYF